MNWLTLFFAIQAGIISQNVRIAPVGVDYWFEWQTPLNTMEATLSAKALFFEHLELSGFMRSYQIPDQPPYFIPFRIDYGAVAAIVWGPLRVGINHECDHVVNDLYTTSPTKTLFDAKSTEFFIRFESKASF